MSYIDNTWVAYALEREDVRDRVKAGLARVEDHYGRLFADPLIRHTEGHGPIGVTLWHRDDPRLRWPLWADADSLTVAATNAPTGWTRVAGDVPPSEAPIPLGRALQERPERLAELNPPFVIAVLDRARGRLTIVNDFLATGRLYELRTELGTVWSNRLGALPLFAGIRPEADPHGWGILAASGWFLGSATPIRGAEKVAPGSVIVAEADQAGGARVRRRQTDSVRDLVRPRRLSWFRRAAGKAASEAVELAHAVDQLWDEQPILNFSGGRDSRVSAAGAVGAGLPATFRTMDIHPGEADTVRQLVAAAPAPLEHVVTEAERGEQDDDLADRLRAQLLVHDGLNNPMSLVRSALALPQEGFAKPLITGHGGELAHGFYYSAEGLDDLERGGFKGLVKRLERFGRQKHNAAREHAYEAYTDEVRRTLEEGRTHGVRGPSLLDYFYMAQRLSFRAGLGSRNDRYSGCATPAFIRAAFDLNPRQRADAKLHRAIVGRLVPPWNEVPFFHGETARLPSMNRDRIWEKPGHAEELEEMLHRESLWEDLFDPDRVREVWQKARTAHPHSSFEPLFLRIAWRVGYEDHLKMLGDRATGTPDPGREAARTATG